ncbi:hypothetical protein ACW5R3_10790 [Bizionia sp. KMM 8389]
MKFNKKYKVYTWKNIMYLHWIINPGILFNELFLGQRIPKTVLIDTSTNKPKHESTYIPCPHCAIIHDGRTWSTNNKTAFKNWFGLYCPNCSNIIPCLRNIFSFLILVITAPIWFWFRSSLKKNWLIKQPHRFTNLDLTNPSNPYSGNGWIKQGLSWGFFMYLIMTFFSPLIFKEPITFSRVLISIPIWFIGGLGFGYLMKLFIGNSNKNTD